ncbi:MAG TPA: hypothetical protein VFO76_12085 [Candidatus Kapabacteria bacterium]|nr:hypothetical protein [Candidatus Kapabacteria bacterium]
MRQYQRFIAAFLFLSTAINFSVTPLFAQVKSFESYLNKLVVPTAMPADGALTTVSADSLDTTLDLRSLQNELDTYVKSLRADNSGPNANSSKNFGKQKTAPPKGKTRDSVVSNGNDDQMLATVFSGVNPDSCLALAKSLQELRNTYDASYKAITDVYNYHVHVAIEQSNRLQQKEPCGNDQNCFKTHQATYHKDLSSASKDRITSNLSLLSSQLQQLRPLLQKIDVVIPKQFPVTASAQTKRIINGLIENSKDILSAITEQLKLQRIFVAEYSKLIKAS